MRPCGSHRLDDADYGERKIRHTFACRAILQTDTMRS